MSYSYGDASNSVRLASDVGVELSDLVLVDFRELWLNKSLGVDQIFLEQRLLNDLKMLLIHSVVWQHLLCECRLNLS